MNENILATISRLSDDALVAKLKLLAQGSRQNTVELIAHLSEVATRNLHRREGPGRLFGYCTQILRFSEAAAWNRIKAAKAARKFPIVLDLLADGSVNLTTIRLLAPHLTAENHRALLAEATGMTRRQVDSLVARIAPQGDVRTSIRKLPAPQPRVPAAEAVPVSSSQPGDNGMAPATAAGAPPVTLVAAAEGAAWAPPPAAHRPVVAPLSPERYRVQITIDEETRDDLRVLQDSGPRSRDRVTSRRKSNAGSGKGTAGSAPFSRRTGVGARSAATSNTTTPIPMPTGATRRWKTSRFAAGTTTSTSRS